MIESGEPSATLKGMHRSELEGTGGTATVIYSEEKIQVFLPDDVMIQCGRNIDLTSLDITIQCKDVDATAANMHINADTLQATIPEIEIIGNIRIIGNVNITGNVTVTGNIDATGDVTAGGISLRSHVHGGVMGGPGITSTPQ